jgi:hypothetical protein
MGGPRRAPKPPALRGPAKPCRSAGAGAGMALEEKVIASWKYKKGALDQKTAFLCYLVANLTAGNTH